VFLDDIETLSIRIQKKEEALAKVQATLQKKQEEAKEIQKKIMKEKQEQINSL
jgi:O-acetylhomoserine/O-acetylserine sulfhydrylase-like pyridoxal-dependent enzyme